MLAASGCQKSIWLDCRVRRPETTGGYHDPPTFGQTLQFID